MKVRNTFIIFLVSGFWHGANWTFIVWGGLNAVYFLPLLLTNSNRKNIDVVAQGNILPTIGEIWMMLKTFFLTIIAWIFFRADSLSDALLYIKNIFTTTIFSIPEIMPLYLMLFLLFFLVVEWIHRDKQHGLQFNKGDELSFSLSNLGYCGFYILLGFCIAFYMGKENTFIYFQF